MEKEPLISIIIPVYNVEKYVQRCLDSVLAQTYKNIEIILIDDGSTDQSGKICEGYAAKDQRIKMFRQPNQGLSAARNAGLKVFTGEYFAFIDSDDYVDADYIEYLFNNLSNVYGNMSICALVEEYEQPEVVPNPDGTMPKVPKIPAPKNYGNGYKKTTLSPETCLIRMLNEEGFNVAAYAKLFHRSLAHGVEFPVGKLYEDLGTTYKFIMQAQRIAYGEEPKYHYMRHEGTIASNKQYTDQKMDIIKLTDQMCTDIDHVFKTMSESTNLRRAHARFSVLRIMVNSPSLTDMQKVDMQNLIEWLKKHSDYVQGNKHATSKDKMALMAAKMGPGVFKTAYSIYKK